MYLLATEKYIFPLVWLLFQWIRFPAGIYIPGAIIWSCSTAVYRYTYYYFLKLNHNLNYHLIFLFNQKESILQCFFSEKKSKKDLKFSFSTRILYIKAQGWVKYKIGESRLLILILIFGLFLNLSGAIILV
jgi:hypothetical protein